MTDEQYIQEFITNGLYEDTRGFDHTSLLAFRRKIRAKLIF
jgi:hypothetical protein